jgi:hypothetical protein
LDNISHYLSGEVTVTFSGVNDCSGSSINITNFNMGMLTLTGGTLSNVRFNVQYNTSGINFESMTIYPPDNDTVFYTERSPYVRAYDCVFDGNIGSGNWRVLTGENGSWVHIETSVVKNCSNPFLIARGRATIYSIVDGGGNTAGGQVYSYKGAEVICFNVPFKHSKSLGGVISSNGTWL